MKISDATIERMARAIVNNPAAMDIIRPHIVNIIHEELVAAKLVVYVKRSDHDHDNQQPANAD